MKFNYMAIIFLTDTTGEMGSLTQYRPLASLPIGGSYRIIDFPLSNFTNAGIKNLGIFCNSSEINSLSDHIRNGKEWDLDRKRDGVFLFRNLIENSQDMDIKRLRKNIEYFARSSQKNIIITNANMLFNIDYVNVIKEHENSGKEVTILYKKVDNATTSFQGCDLLDIRDGKLVDIRRNIGLEDDENISMDTYILSKELFIKLLLKTIHSGEYKYANDIVRKNISSLDINLYEFKEHLFAIKNTRDYFNFNMSLLENDVKNDLFGHNGNRKIYTKIKDTPATFFKKDSSVKNSLISNGCVIGGKVENSILGRGTIIEKGAEVLNSVILQDCVIKKGSFLKNVILDKNNVIKENETLISSHKCPLVIEKTFRWDLEEYQDIIKTFSEREAKK